MIHERHMNIIWKNCECETAHVHIRPKQGAFLFLRLCWQTMFSLTNRALGCYIVPIPDDVGRASFFSGIFRDRRLWLQAANVKKRTDTTRRRNRDARDTALNEWKFLKTFKQGGTASDLHRPSPQDQAVGTGVFCSP